MTNLNIQAKNISKSNMFHKVVSHKSKTSTICRQPEKFGKRYKNPNSSTIF